jgi:phosphoribosylaminoimidazolecarboxamide formyltransferase/IMP cyclohydrolase
MKTALMSVYEKTGLVDFAKALYGLGWSFLASGGTARLLFKASLPVTTVTAYTGSPEILGGRVKTLHPAISGGILARETPEDAADLGKIGADKIDLVVCNLYPFEQMMDRPGTSTSEVIEYIDIGGVTLIRAAAKNYARVTVLTDPGDYGAILAELKSAMRPSIETRKRLAHKAYSLTAAYDTAIRDFLGQEIGS